MVRKCIWFLDTIHTPLVSFLFCCYLISNASIYAIDLPEQFEDVTILSELRDPASMAFSPDGRLFWGERLTGNLRVATFDGDQDIWIPNPQPFYTFNVPTQRHRSSGLRGFTFDPDFQENGFIYAFYMSDNPRHNKVVRIQADPSNPDQAILGSETVLIDLPFNKSTSSGSHNGGDMAFGQDGKLYFTTGDGWDGGDPVQSLNTFTGKLFRINKDGTIPNDNPFYEQTNGAYRAIYCLGLRNPYTMSVHPESGNIYINDAVGDHKATVFQVKVGDSDEGLNFAHDGYNGIGLRAPTWTNVSVNNIKLVTGGAWYPQNGYWPEEYKGNYFAALWGRNASSSGALVRITSEGNLSKELFASNVVAPQRNKPVMTKIGPDYNLYFMLTDYETGQAEIHMVRYTGVPRVATPQFDPPSGHYQDPIQVRITSITPNATIYYTLDGSTPSNSSQLYSQPILVDGSVTIQTRAYAEGLEKSNTGIASYTIGERPNVPPVADAGPDITATVFQRVTLNGTNSYDPDGNPLDASESWEQISGPEVRLLDADETVANFTPSQQGQYVFRITITDLQGATDTDDVIVNVVEDIPDVLDNLIARWTMEEGEGNLLKDYSVYSHVGQLNGANWSEETKDGSSFSLAFDGVDDRVDIGNLDVTGNEMTITFWYKADDFGVSDARFISKASGQFDDEHLWMVSSLNSDKLRFRLRSNGQTTTLISPSGVLPVGEWTHVSAVYDGTQMRLYTNGNEVARANKTGNIDSDPLVKVAIGNQPGDVTGGVRPFDGLIDEMRIYGRALSEVEIASVRDASPVAIQEPVPSNDAPQINWLSPEPYTVLKKGDSTLLSVNAQDTDGTIDRVAFTLNGIVVEEDFDAPYEYVWTAVDSGTYEWKAFAYDDKEGVDSTSTLTLEVESIQEVPAPDTVPTPTDKVKPVVWYTFEENEGNIVRDVSGIGSPIDLDVPIDGNTEWVKGGLKLVRPTLLAATTSSEKIVNAIQASQEITLEAWITSSSLTQGGPARILTLSHNPYLRNVTLGQSGTSFNARLRTTRSDLNGRPDINTSNGLVTQSLTHVVFTKDQEGNASFYVNGKLSRTFQRRGDFSNWDSSYRLGVGNEWSEDRPWLGTLYELAIYDQALDGTRIDELYQAQRYQLPEETDNPFNVNEVAPKKRIIVYPNPASEAITVERESSERRAELRLTDLHGKMVMPLTVMNDKKMSFDIRHLSKGVYFLQLRIDAEVINKKILIERQ